MALLDFFQKYFIQPILQDEGYNIYNTLTWALLAILILYGLYYMFKKLDVPIDIKIIYAGFPFIFLGSMMRSFVDHDYYVMTFWKKIFLITPGIWLLSVGLFAISYLIGYFVYEKAPWKVAASIGSVIVITNILLVINKISLEKFTGVAIVLGIFISICAAIYFVAKKLDLAHLKGVGYAAAIGQIWDATNTSVILSLYGGSEKHVFPKWLIANLGPWSFFIVKLLVIFPAVYLMYKYVENEKLRNMFLIGIFVLGAGEGLRNFISMILA